MGRRWNRRRESVARIGRRGGLLVIFFCPFRSLPCVPIIGRSVASATSLLLLLLLLLLSVVVVVVVMLLGLGRRRNNQSESVCG